MLNDKVNRLDPLKACQLESSRWLYRTHLKISTAVIQWFQVTGGFAQVSLITPRNIWLIGTRQKNPQKSEFFLAILYILKEKILSMKNTGIRRSAEKSHPWYCRYLHRRQHHNLGPESAGWWWITFPHLCPSYKMTPFTQPNHLVSHVCFICEYVPLLTWCWMFAHRL